MKRGPHTVPPVVAPLNWVTRGVAEALTSHGVDKIAFAGFADEHGFAAPKTFLVQSAADWVEVGAS